jgi:DNA-binding GntR family transcriptional regulator
MTDLDRLVPLYAQVKQRLAERIRSGALAEGEFLSPEPELCAEFGVSRITIRRAVAELCDEGLLIRQQGRGTIVAPAKMQQTLVSLSGFSDAFAASGRPVRHLVLSADTGVSDAAAEAVLGASAAGRLACFLRLITVEDRPLTLETLYLDAGRYPDIVAPVSAGTSFFQTLRDKGGPRPAAADRIINVGFATTEERRHLQIGAWQPVYRIDKTLFGDCNEPIAWSRLVTPTHLITYSLRG